jgi:ribosome biogenesis GTPase / thiamine phosphate phosphatase
MTDNSIVGEFEAEVIAAFGRHLIVRAGGEEMKARPSGRRLSIVCGDRVRCELVANQGVLIHEVLPRRSLLARANMRGDSEPVVANITRLVVVVAPLPRPDFFVVDRYLCAATAAGIDGALAINKADLGAEAEIQDELAAFTAAGYTQLRCSATAGQGLEELRALLSTGASVLVGQSGVGKSSLVRALLPETEIATGGLMREEEGRHTTTASRAYQLAPAGVLIDSPGVRDFAPAIDLLDPRTLGFPEVATLSQGCRFADCKHIQEPGCNVMNAVAGGKLSPRRYESYRRLRRLFTDLVEIRGPGQRKRH